MQKYQNEILHSKNLEIFLHFMMNNKEYFFAAEILCRLENHSCYVPIWIDICEGLDPQKSLETYLLADTKGVWSLVSKAQRSRLNKIRINLVESYLQQKIYAHFNVIRKLYYVCESKDAHLLRRLLDKALGRWRKCSCFSSFRRAKGSFIRRKRNIVVSKLYG